MNNQNMTENLKNLEYYSLYAFGKILSYTQPTMNVVYDSVYGNEFNVDEIIPGLYISDFYSACEKDKLIDMGITHIVTAIVGVDSIYPSFFDYHIIDVSDRKYSDIKIYFDECCEFINNAITNGGKVLVHCKCGVSRSATIVAAYLINKKNYTTKNAIELMKKKRNCINPNDGFILQLEQYEFDIKNWK
jgi:protein-tyrosine phosphatase